MEASTAGLLIDVALLAVGLYVYLFARGAVRFGDAPTRERTEAFRRENATWMRLLGLALVAIMVVNIGLYFFG